MQIEFIVEFFKLSDANRRNYYVSIFEVFFFLLIAQIDAFANMVNAYSY